MKNRESLRGTLAALMTYLIFGFSFLFSKKALSVAHPLIILAVRFAVAFVAMNLLLLTGKFKIRLRGKKKGALIAMSMVQPLFYYIFELYGIALTSSAFFNVLSRRISAEFSPFERTYVMFSVGSAGFFLLAAAVLRGRFLSELTAAANGTFWGSVGYLAIVASVLAFLLYNDATGRISSVRVASFSNLTTVVSVLAGTLILGETFRWDQWLLCAGIIFGVWGGQCPDPGAKSG